MLFMSMQVGGDRGRWIFDVILDYDQFSLGRRHGRSLFA
jgi:hypothetical protein